MKVKLLPVALLCSAIGVWAQKPMPNRGVEILPDESVSSYRTENAEKINSSTGYVLSVGNIWISTQGDTPEAQARNFLKENPTWFGFSETEMEQLTLKGVRESKGSINVHFDQYIGNIPVLNGRVSVTLNELGEVTFVSNNFKYELSKVGTQAAITDKQAKDIASRHLGFAQPNYLSADLTIYQNNEGSYLVHRVLLSGSELVGEWEVLVDALNGKLIKVADAAVYHRGSDEKKDKETTGQRVPSTGNGNVFIADPLSSSGQTYGGNYSDNGDNANTQLDAELFNVTLQDIDLTGGTYSLVGPYAEIVDFENPSNGLFSQASSTFSFDRQASGFEAVNTYYHIDNSMRYINETLNIALMPYQYSGGVRYDPHGLNGADNSYFSTGTGRLAFGEGGVDDAEDADVILHELGHGLHDWVTLGGLSQQDGLSEGSGDYWAQSYSRSLGQWATTDAAYNYVFDWDGHNVYWNGRITNYGASYPGGLVGQIHTDGQIWSTCLMQIWDAIGRTNTDMAFLEGLAMTNGGSDQNDAAIAFQQAAINMNYSSIHLNTIHTILESCGYTMPDLPVLQVELMWFSGERTDAHKVELTWEAGVKESFGEYEVQRRVGNSFETIGKVRVSDQQSKYVFVDEEAPLTEAFYRLKANKEFSRQVKIAGWQQTDLQVFPNPSQDILRIALTVGDDRATASNVVIRNILGEVVMEFEAGQQQFDISSLSDGTYILVVKVGNQQLFERIVKRTR